MENKWVFITGSNRGIGEKILQKFVANGYHAYAHARSSSAEFEEKIAALRAEYGAEILPVYFDLTDSEAMKREMQALIRGKKQIDVLVNNAGVLYTGLFQMTEMQTIREVFDVNVFALMELTQYVTRIMVRKKRGSIVNLSSIAGSDPGKGMCAYGVSKAAVAAFTKTLAQELGYYGIRVNAVAPGFVSTEMLQRAGVEEKAVDRKKGAFDRPAQPEEIADAVYYLASEQASFINGEVLRVDGGGRLR